MMQIYNFVPDKQNFLPKNMARLPKNNYFCKIIKVYKQNNR